jgi:putative transposase
MARRASIVIPGYVHHTTQRKQFREGWRGHLWQWRLTDNAYLMSAVRYVAPNPARAGLAKAVAQYRLSSPAACLSGRDDPLIRGFGLNKTVDDEKDICNQFEHD